MTRILLDQTIIQGFRRCQESEVRYRDEQPYTFRQCLRDEGHLNACEFGQWFAVQRETRCCNGNDASCPHARHRGEQRTAERVLPEA